MTRRRGAEISPVAPTAKSYAGFALGQQVSTQRRPFCGGVTGTISRIVLSDHWRFAVVEDADGGTHACEFDELS